MLPIMPLLFFNNRPQQLFKSLADLEWHSCGPLIFVLNLKTIVVLSTIEASKSSGLGLRIITSLFGSVDFLSRCGQIYYSPFEFAHYLYFK